MGKRIKDFLEKYAMYYGSIDLETACQQFILEMTKGLAGDPSSLAMIPTYLTVTTDIVQNEAALVIDAGGTNFRVGKVVFDEMMQPVISDVKKTQMPGIKEELSKEAFFQALVNLTEKTAQGLESIGFCFSYAAEVGPDKDAVLLNWSKEVKAPEVVGEK